MAYAETDELARILLIRTPSDEQTEAMDRALEAAAAEIDAELDLSDDAVLSSKQKAIRTTVNLERAVEHFQQAPFGLLPLGGELGGAERTARNSWERHAHKLAPLKDQWGIA